MSSTIADEDDDDDSEMLEALALSISFTYVCVHTVENPRQYYCYAQA